MNVPSCLGKWLGLLLGVLLAAPGWGQSAIGKPWGRTDLDTLVSVQTPYRAQDVTDEAVPWLTVFFTKGSFYHFMMVRLSVEGIVQQRLAAQAQRGKTVAETGAVTLDFDKVLQGLVQLPFTAISKPRKKREYAVSMPAVPGAQASHRLYTGIDPDSREPAEMEVRWFEEAGVVYFFFCTTLDITGEDARQEKLRYFSSIALRHR